MNFILQMALEEAPHLEGSFHDTDPRVAPTENLGIHRQYHQ
jgi:hypothetical protein